MSAAIQNVLRRIENGAPLPQTWKEEELEEYDDNDDEAPELEGRRRDGRKPSRAQPQAMMNSTAKRKASAAARVVAEQHRRAAEVLRQKKQHVQRQHLQRPQDDPGIDGEGGAAADYLQLTPRGMESDPTAETMAAHANRQMRTSSAPPRMSPGPRTRQGRLLRPVETVVAARREKASLAVSSPPSSSSSSSSSSSGVVSVEANSRESGRAAVRVQATWRGTFVRWFVVDIELYRVAAVVLQREWRRWLMLVSSGRRRRRRQRERRDATPMHNDFGFQRGGVYAEEEEEVDMETTVSRDNLCKRAGGRSSPVLYRA